MIFAVAWAAAGSRWQTLTGFALVFGVWDVAYYAALQILLGWPASLFEPDLLFLIPVVWVGPVWAPSLIGLSVAAGAVGRWRGGSGVLRPGAAREQVRRAAVGARNQNPRGVPSAGESGPLERTRDAPGEDPDHVGTFGRLGIVHPPAGEPRRP